MIKKDWNNKPSNKTVAEIYDAYRSDMQKMLGLEYTAPHKFSNKEFVEHFECKVDRLDTLIALYADLVLASKNWN